MNLTLKHTRYIFLRSIHRGASMRLVGFTTLITLGALSPWLVYACSQPQVETSFDAVAPTATDIVAVQVESLALESDSFPAGSGHTFRGKIRVLKHYRGSGQFVDIKYSNSRCSGLRIDVGGIYLVATNSLTPTIELNSHAAPILHVSGFFTYDPDVVLRLSDVVRRLEAALRGDGTFAITTSATRREMSTLSSPPHVPPPEEGNEE